MEALQTLAALMPHGEATDSDAHAAVLLHVKPDAKGPALASPRGAGLLACLPGRILADWNWHSLHVHCRSRDRYSASDLRLQSPCLMACPP